MIIQSQPNFLPNLITSIDEERGCWEDAEAIGDFGEILCLLIYGNHIDYNPLPGYIGSHDMNLYLLCYS
jgi:hypothetical protein